VTYNGIEEANEDPAPMQIVDDVHVDPIIIHVEAHQPNAVEAQPEVNLIEAPKGLTKKGNPRKRIPPRNKDEIKTKRQKNKEKHEIQPPCDEKCKRGCTKKILQDRREVIHHQFWDMEENERKLFILGHVNKSIVKRRTTEEESRRGTTFIYNLTTTDGERKTVCKQFFLTTLGYKKKNDMFVFNTLTQAKEGITPKQDACEEDTELTILSREM